MRTILTMTDFMSGADGAGFVFLVLFPMVIGIAVSLLAITMRQEGEEKPKRRPLAPPDDRDQGGRRG